MKFIIAFLLTTSLAFADCPKNVQKLSEGSSAPCTGWLVSEPKMQDITKSTDELELTKKLVQSQEQLIKLSDAEIEFYKRRSVSQQEELNKAEIRQFWATAGAFALGVVLTGIAAKAAIEAAR
jgi:hypothetical protein